jgi:hypothetical protein
MHLLKNWIFLSPLDVNLNFQQLKERNYGKHQQTFLDLLFLHCLFEEREPALLHVFPQSPVLLHSMFLFCYQI